MTSSPDFARNYKAVLSLNNMAVSLLERHSFRHSLDAFKDAIVFMSTSLFDINPADTNSQVRQTSRIEKKLLRVSKLLASPKLSRVHSTSGTTLCLDTGLISSGQKAVALGDTTNHDEASLCRPLPFRIEALDPSCPDNMNMELESGILVYNYAVARFYASKTERDPHEAEKLKTAAFQLLQYILNTLSSPLLSSFAENDQIGRHQCILLSMVTIKCIVNILDDLGRHAESLTYYAQLAQLRIADLELGYLSPFTAGMDYPTAPAA